MDLDKASLKKASVKLLEYFFLHTMFTKVSFNSTLLSTHNQLMPFFSDPVNTTSVNPLMLGFYKYSHVQSPQDIGNCRPNRPWAWRRPRTNPEESSRNDKIWLKPQRPPTNWKPSIKGSIERSFFLLVPGQNPLIAVDFKAAHELFLFMSCLDIFLHPQAFLDQAYLSIVKCLVMMIIFPNRIDYLPPHWRIWFPPSAIGCIEGSFEFWRFYEYRGKCKRSSTREPQTGTTRTRGSWSRSCNTQCSSRWFGSRSHEYPSRHPRSGSEKRKWNCNSRYNFPINTGGIVAFSRLTTFLTLKRTPWSLGVVRRNAPEFLGISHNTSLPPLSPLLRSFMSSHRYLLFTVVHAFLCPLVITQRCIDDPRLSEYLLTSCFGRTHKVVHVPKKDRRRLVCLSSCKVG